MSIYIFNMSWHLVEIMNKFIQRYLTSSPSDNHFSSESSNISPSPKAIHSSTPIGSSSQSSDDDDNLMSAPGSSFASVIESPSTPLESPVLSPTSPVITKQKERVAIPTDSDSEDESSNQFSYMKNATGKSPKIIQISDDSGSESDSGRRKPNVSKLRLAEAIPAESLLLKNDLVKVVNKKVDKGLKQGARLQQLEQSKCVGQFNVMVSRIALPSVDTAHRPLDTSFLAELAQSMARNEQHQFQRAIVNLTTQLPPTEKSNDSLKNALKAIAKHVAQLKEYKGRESKKEDALKVFNKMQAIMKENDLFFLIDAATHTVIAHMICSKKKGKDTEDIFINADVYVDLDAVEREEVAAAHNRASSTVMADDLSVAMNAARRVVIKKNKRKENGEYIVGKDEKEFMSNTYGITTEHVLKCLCLNDRCWKEFMRIVSDESSKVKSVSFCQNLNIAFPEEFKYKLLKDLADHKIKAQDFKARCEQKARSDQIVTALLKQSWYKENDVRTAEDLEKVCPVYIFYMSSCVLTYDMSDTYFICLETSTTVPKNHKR